jgi:hypothetical protein
MTSTAGRFVIGQTVIYTSSTGKKIHASETCSVSSASRRGDLLPVTWNDKWAVALAKGRIQVCGKCGGVS